MLPLDADDLLEPTYVEQAAGLLDRGSDLAFVSCALQAFGDDSYRWKPPLDSLADLVVRGAHSSGVFRREMWTELGGFEETLDAYEDNEFWISALAAGFRGVVLDEPLLRYRIRRGSRYFRGLEPESYLEAKLAILRKHAATLAAQGEEILVALLGFERELRTHAAFLQAERARLDGEGAALTKAVEAVAAELQGLGAHRYDWGTLGSVSVTTSELELAAELRESVLTEVVDTSAELTAVVRRGERLPTARDQLDTIALCDVLETESDPGAVVEETVKALRPGGRLVVVARGMGWAEEGDLHRFTDATLRSLLTRSFPAGSVDVSSVGGFQPVVAALGCVGADEAAHVRPERDGTKFPLVLAATATKPKRPAAKQRRFKRSKGRAAARTAPRPAQRGTMRFGSAGILAYHRVAERKDDPHSLCVSPEAFRRQMEIVSKRCNPVSLEELTAGLTEGGLPPRSVALTFDDGYRDNLEQASPVLLDLGLPATFFIITGALGTPQEGWWDLVERLLAADADIPDSLTIDNGKERVEIATRLDAERRRARSLLHERMLEASKPERDDVLSALIEWSGGQTSARESDRLMSTDEVADLASRPGHSIGSHTVSHLALPASSPQCRRIELTDSRRELESLTGSTVDALAYPYGAWDEETVELAAQAGYEVAVTVDRGLATLDTDPLVLPRVDLCKTPPEHFESSLLPWLERVRP